MINYKIYTSDTAGKIDIEKEEIWGLYQIAKEQ